MGRKLKRILCLIMTVLIAFTAMPQKGYAAAEGGEIEAIATGVFHTVALKEDGTVVAWGDNRYGQCTVPSGLTGVKAIAAGRYFTFALKEDGTVVAWGDNDYGKFKVPSDLTGVKAIAAGDQNLVALKEDGTVVAWGSNEHGESTVPSGLTGVKAISAGLENTTVALKEDGTVVVWGIYTEPAGLAGILDIYPVTGVMLDRNELSFTKYGQTDRLVSTVTPLSAANKKVLWTSSNELVATVSEDGTVTAVGNGTAVITAFTEYGSYTAKCNIMVKIPDKVQEFVIRLYTKVLNRNASDEEISYYTDKLNSRTVTGTDVGRGFVFSPEFQKLGLSNADYIEVLYQTFMGRNSDDRGKTYWQNMLDNGVTRGFVFHGFVESTEFIDICSSYGIDPGPPFIIIDPIPDDQNANLTMFISRMYTKALGRTAESEGLEYYAREITAKNVTPVQAAQNFIFSPEFENKNLSNEEYVKVLYRVFMGREYDQDGLNYHLQRMSENVSRAEILLGFANSLEFENIRSGFGL